MSLKEQLERGGIRHFDVLIHDQSKSWLVKYFSKGADEYPVNVSMLMRNIIWQTRERIIKGEIPPLKKLIRVFWYMYIKPILSRVDALAEGIDQYKQLVEQFVFMVKKLKVMRYSDIGFMDENKSHRRVGPNANIVLFSEKIGHQDFLNEIADKYKVSIIALGGQPSLLNNEYFVDDLKDSGINLQRSFYLFSIVDFDPSGWIIRDAFLDNLKFYGIKNIRVFDLISPDMLSKDEILFSRYRVPVPESMKTKNEAWIKAVKENNFRNLEYLIDRYNGQTILYGLESESISDKRLTKLLAENIAPILGKSDDLVKLYELKKLNETIKALIIYKITSA